MAALRAAALAASFTAAAPFTAAAAPFTAAHLSQTSTLSASKLSLHVGDVSGVDAPVAAFLAATRPRTPRPLPAAA